MVRKEKQIYRKLFTLFNVHRRDVTLLSLVHVENIPFDATCGLLISPRNEGIRYSGREPEGEERKEPNSDDEELHGVAFVIQQVVILSPRAGVFQPSGKVA